MATLRKYFWVILNFVCITIILTACAPGSRIGPTPTVKSVSPTENQEPVSTPLIPSAEASLATPTIFATYTPVPGISEEQNSLIPPIPPHDVSAVQKQGYIEITWKGTGVDIDTHYVVYRRPSGSMEWQIIGYVLAEGDNTGEYSYQDFSASKVVSPEYAISTFDRYGKESMLSEITMPK